MSRLAWLTSLLVPADLLHEATHMVVAYPFANVGFERTRLGAVSRIEWREGTPILWVRIAHLAPTIAGTIMGLLLVPFLPLLDHTFAQLGEAVAITMGAPEAAPEISLLIALAALINWIQFVCPSYGDLFPFRTAD
ncbi:hypothetical protein [Natrinema sp. DC36]|uniref:hypothetical protein n=1 Tax=Natrinema sp. DC36 TaxID=2878680 RepID=UPI001CF0A1F1|nr:hypothetical protein [Natrinema sp. DC36]